MNRWGALLLVGFLAAFGGGTAFAAPDDGVNVGRASDAMTLTESGIDPDLLAKQKEIDDFVFGKGSEVLGKLGFKVTHTGPVGDRVEIGILPYKESHAEFLYETFGRDRVSVVEGINAVLVVDEPTYSILPAPAEGAAPDAVPKRADPDQPVSSAAGGAASDSPLVVSASADALSAGKMEIATTQATEKKDGTVEASVSKSPLASPFLYTAAGAAVLIAIAVALGRKRLTAPK